jgi:hypothetical protein
MSEFNNQLKHLTTFASQQIHPRPHRSLSTFRLSTEPRRMRWLGLLLTFNLSFLISACGLDVEDPTPPSPPIWVQKSLPEEWPERGIDAHESGGIYLEWEPSSEINIVAYHIFRAELFDENDSLGDYELIHRIEVASRIGSNYLDSDAEVRTKYFYKLKAEDLSENLGEFSISLSYSLLPSLLLSRMIPNSLSVALDDARRLIWQYDYFLEMENYCLTILTNDNVLIFRELLSPGNYVANAETFIIPEKVFLESNQIYQWRVDTGAQYEEGLELSGSESPWARFLYLNE